MSSMLHLKGVAPLLTTCLFITSAIACSIWPVVDPNSQPLHDIDCRQLLKTIIGIAPIRRGETNSKLSQTNSIPVYDDLESGRLPRHVVLKLKPNSMRLWPSKSSVFSRISRGRISRMPLQYGKRYDVKTKLTPSAWGSHGDDILKSHDQQTYHLDSAIRDHSLTPQLTNIERLAGKGKGDLYSDESFRKRSFEKVDGFWRGKTNPREFSGFYGGDGGIGLSDEDILPERITRGRLDRMPSTFGKKRKRGVLSPSPDGRLSSFIYRIDKQGSSAYKTAMKKLARLGITFMRGNRARLSRMPQLYGRRRRDELAAYYAMTGKNKAEKMDSGVEKYKSFSPVEDMDEENNENEAVTKTMNKDEGGFHNNGIAKSSPPEPNGGYDSKLLMNSLPSAKFWKHKTQGWSKKPARYDLLSSETPILSSNSNKGEAIETDRRSALSRMPMTFGKKSADLSPEELLEIDHSGDIEDNSHISASIRGSYDEAGEQNNVNNFILHPFDKHLHRYSNNFRSHLPVFKTANQIKTPNQSNAIRSAIPSNVESLSVPASTDDFEVDGELKTSRRSALNRMPMTFGKREMRIGVETIHESFLPRSLSGKIPLLVDESEANLSPLDIGSDGIDTHSPSSSLSSSLSSSSALSSPQDNDIGTVMGVRRHEKQQ